jgi:hypothetical protein
MVRQHAKRSPISSHHGEIGNKLVVEELENSQQVEEEAVP